MKKTLETLAIQYQNGDASALPELWEQLRKLYLMKCRKYFLAHRVTCDRCGIDLHDMEQACFFAMLGTVKAYDRTAEPPLLAYVNFHFKRAMRELLGLRTEREASEPLNHCSSLNAPITADDPDGGELLDLIDSGEDVAADAADELDKTIDAEIVREEVNKLPEKQRIVIVSYYFDGLTQEQIGEQLGCSHQRARQIRIEALRKLSCSKPLRILYGENQLQKKMQNESKLAMQPELYEMRAMFSMLEAASV